MKKSKNEVTRMSLLLAKEVAKAFKIKSATLDQKPTVRARELIERDIKESK